MSPIAIAVGLLVVAAVAVVAFLVRNSNRSKRGYEHIPPALRPAYSDEQLETTVLERYMQWGLVLTVAMAVALPLYWLNEEPRLNDETDEFFVEAVVRGEEEYQANCSECHSANLGGGAASSPYSDATWPAPALSNIATRYEDSPNVPDVRDFIIQTLQRGRPGTPMPTWGSAYGGPMTDQQIADITSYILANQVTEVTEATPASDMSGEELYQGNCSKCHGADLQGIVGPTLLGVTERHSREDIVGILNGGLYMPTGAVMPGFGQEQYQYEDARYTEEALDKIVDYLEERQPGTPGDELLQYQTPGIGQQAALDALAEEDAGGGAAGDASEAPTTGGASEAPATDASDEESST